MKVYIWGWGKKLQNSGDCGVVLMAWQHVSWVFGSWFLVIGMLSLYMGPNPTNKNQESSRGTLMSTPWPKDAENPRPQLQKPKPHLPWTEFICVALWFQTDGCALPRPQTLPLTAPCLVLYGFMGFQNWRMAPCPDPKALPAAETSLNWAAAGFTHAAAMVWCDFGWRPVWFYGISKLTDGPLSRSQSPPRSRDLLELSCGWLYPCCGNGLMGFRLAPCLVLWDFKTDGWPPVPIPKPSPQPRPPWIHPCPDPKALPAAGTSLDSAAAGFTHAAAMVWCDFGWRPVWFYGISKLTDGPCPDPKAFPAAETCCSNGLMGFRLAPCLVLWDFKTDGWPPVPIPKPSPQPRPPWIELRLALNLPMLRQWFDAISAGKALPAAETSGWPPVPIPKPSPQPRPPWIQLRLALVMLRQWFDAISAGTLSGFMGFQNWRMAPCPDPKAFPAAETCCGNGLMGFRLAPCLVLWDFKTDGWPLVPIPKPSPRPRAPGWL